MKKKNVKTTTVLILLAAILSITHFVALPSHTAHAFTAQVIQRGATGDDVVELQARLQYNGYYHGPIDGVYGWSTYWAVRNFQHQFELKEIDGLVGTKTKNMLADYTKFYAEFVHTQLNKGRDFTHYGGIPLKQQVAPTKAEKAKFKQQAEARRAQQEKQYAARQPAGEGTEGQETPEQPQEQSQEQGQPPQPQPEEQAQPDQQAQPEEQAEPQQQNAAVNMPEGFSQNDIQLMANAVYGEARGEPYVGQVAVAAVILNRLNSPTFPNTISGVIFEPRAFTAVADGQIWLTPNERAKEAVMDAINGWDPSENAMYYFNPITATSGWIWGRPQKKQIGKHIFCD
ncbi:spore cortex-lytic enzyme [Bacillus lacus]|uniref:Spore cortex-lytic enzyme n=1 Tax=Metabacillus lacus TaxID=1983721 RepID=A0A7X2IXP3_9BACI|nr:spore cortex-lytic enzyme [Metabacillus lacus]MRX71023.1 spore cortex-lytic enzyme [Metabacillus lacus]